MSESEQKRKYFDILAGVILVGFVIFTAVVFLGTAAIPSLRERPPKDGPEQLLKSGYRISSTQYYDLKFSADDSRVLCQRVENFTKDRFDTVRQEKSLEFPTGRIARNPQPARPMPVRDEVVRTLLTHYGFAQEIVQFEMAVSHDGRELAFLQHFPNGTEAILLRTLGGTYRNLSSGPLPVQLTRLAALGRTRVPLIERLASPQELEWADAVIETTLQNGPDAVLMADRVISKVSRPGPDRDMLVRLLCRISRVSNDPSAAGRAIVSAMEDPTLQRQIEQGLLKGGEVEEDAGVEPVKILEALLRRDWGTPDDFLKMWLIQPMQEGYLEKVSAAMRPTYFRYLQMHLDISFARHLAPVVEGNKDFEAAAAAWAVRMAERRMEGRTVEPDPTAADAAKERQWFTELRARRPDLFK